ncbi:phage holin family protein [uncultured Phascolarctobacterium sp.]|uniref:phage holin family protein n=1 Tax=uncultured Phascolarctobacterium sp. TaxID=512296 RepID=UPI0025ED0F89|nr:phage holin family protein [uncultured Phascolarctobacterium sp.]
MNTTMLAKSFLGAVKTLITGWNYKTIAAAVLALLLHKHAILFYAFAVLVFVDCFTRWIALAHDYLIANGNAAPTLVQSIIGIKSARSAGYIKSDIMKHRFLGKIIVYLFCVITAASGDLIMTELQQPTWAVITIISYLTVTELLSVTENLNAAGVEATQGLADIIKRRKV